MRKLHDERSIELAMEGRRFHDMRRWKIAHTEMMLSEILTLSGKTADSFYKLTDMKETGVRNLPPQELLACYSTRSDRSKSQSSAESGILENQLLYN